MIIVQLEVEQLHSIVMSAVRNVINETSQFTVSKESNPDPWLNVTALRDYHPDKPSAQTVYNWVLLGKIPHHKNGKKLIFLKSEIDAWIKQGRKKTVA